jgi:hypothetical protein
VRSNTRSNLKLDNLEIMAVLAVHEELLWQEARRGSTSPERWLHTTTKRAARPSPVSYKMRA